MRHPAAYTLPLLELPSDGLLNCGVAHQVRNSDVRERMTGIEPATAELQLLRRATIGGRDAYVISVEIRARDNNIHVTHGILDEIKY